MNHYVRLAIFFIIMYAVIYLIRRYPSSAISKLASSWNGPSPINNETISKYMIRWSLYALKQGIIIFIILAAGTYLGQRYDPNIYTNPYFMMFFIFALPLFLGMAVLGGIGCVVRSVWYKLFKPNMRFDEELLKFKNSI